MITLKTQDILYLFRQSAVLFQNASMFFLTSYSANMFQHYFSFYVQLFIAYQRSQKFACYRAPCPEAAGMARRWRLEFDAASDVAEAMLRSLRLMTKSDKRSHIIHILKLHL